jgi:hypothetical protein
VADGDLGMTAAVLVAEVDRAVGGDPDGRVRAGGVRPRGAVRDDRIASGLAVVATDGHALAGDPI